MPSVKFDAVRIAEITVNLLEAPASISAKAAFVNTKTGATHGWTTGRRWTEATMEKLRELRESMERDLTAQHFDDGATTGVTTTSGGSPADALQGLGEHLGTGAESVPQG